MPHVRRSMLITVDADADACMTHSLAEPTSISSRRRLRSPVRSPGMPDTDRAPRRRRSSTATTGRDRRCGSRPRATYAVPFFTWFVAHPGVARGPPRAPARRRPADRGRDRRRGSAPSSSRCPSSRRCRSRPSRRPAWPRSPAVALVANFCGCAALPERRRGHQRLRPVRPGARGRPRRRPGRRAGVAGRDRARRPVGSPPADPGRAGRRVRRQPPRPRSPPRSRCSPARSCSTARS